MMEQLSGEKNSGSPERRKATVAGGGSGGWEEDVSGGRVRVATRKRRSSRAAEERDAEESFCSSESLASTGANEQDESSLWKDGMWQNMRRMLAVTQPEPDKSSEGKGKVRDDTHRSGALGTVGDYPLHASPPQPEPREETGIGPNWTLDLDQLHLGALFYSSEYKRWYVGRYRGENVAVKVLGLVDTAEENGVKLLERLDTEFYREVDLRCRISHKNLGAFKGAYRSPQMWCIATEYCSGGSLCSFLERRNNHVLPLRTLVGFALEMASALAHLHEHGITHGLLSSDNILIMAEGTCERTIRISDFGLAQRDSVIAATMLLPAHKRRWNAPEIIRNEPFDHKVDVYSFGLILWSMFSGDSPFERLPPDVCAEQVANDQIRPQIPSFCPADLGNLMTRCWTEAPTERLEFVQVVDMLNSIDINLQKSVRRARVRRSPGAMAAHKSE